MSLIKPPAVKLQIQINEQVKFGKIAYKPQDSISKVFNDLKRIKILPENINQYQIKYLDRNNVQINKNLLISAKFDPNSDQNLLKINVPPNAINIQQTSKRAEQYIKTNKQKKKQMKQLGEADNFVRKLKPIFSAILSQQYDEVPKLESSEYESVINDYSHEHKQMVLANNIYNSILNLILQSQTIDINRLKGIDEVKSQFREGLDKIVRKYQILQQKEIQRGLMQSKEIAEMTYSIDNLKSALKRSQTVVKDLQQQLRLLQVQKQIYQQDYEKKIKELKLELATKQKLYKKQLQQKQEQIKRINEALPKEIKVSQHLTKYFKYFIDKNVILNSVALYSTYTNKFLQALSKNVQSEIKGLNLLYKFQRLSASDRFHQLIDFKANILLIAKTKGGRIFGGFSNLPFEPHQRKHSPSNILTTTKAFLFNIYKDELYFYPIKPNYDSVAYDPDFIVFGNEEISIDRYNLKVQSMLVSYQLDYLHFEDNDKKRAFFLSDNQQSQAQLTNYQVYQVVT